MVSREEPTFLGPDPFSATLVSLDGTAVVALVGELDLGTAPHLVQVLEPLLEAGPEQLILDCSGLSFMDSSGIAVLVTAQHRLGERGRRLTVHSATPNVLRVFEVTGMLDFFHVRTEPHQSRSLAIGFPEADRMPE